VAFKGFEAKWLRHPLKAAGGRASQPIDDTNAELAARQLLTKDPLPECLIPTDSYAELHSSLASSFFAATPGSEVIFSEKDFTPSLRLCITGTRVLIMMPMQLVWNWANPGGEFSSTRIYQLVSALSAERVHDMARRIPVFSATLGPGDMLYTPPGWVVAERVMAASSNRHVRSDV
jgi:hypothetical protein